MAVHAENCVAADTADTVTLRAHVSCDASTRYATTIWRMGDTVITTQSMSFGIPVGLVQRMLGKSVLVSREVATDITVQARNSVGGLSAVVPVSVTLVRAAPVINACGVSPSAQGTVADSVLVNLGRTVYFEALVSDPLGGIDSCWWSFGDGRHAESRGVFTSRVAHVYTVAGAFRPVLRVRDIRGTSIFDTLRVSVNTPPSFSDSLVLPTALRATDTARVLLAVGDADGDSVRIRIVRGPAAARVSGYEVRWLPQVADTGAQRIEVEALDGRGGCDTLVWEPQVTLAAATDAALQGIVVSAGVLSPAFDSAVVRYALVVPSTAAYYRLKPVAHSANATLSVNGSPLPQGMYCDWRTVASGSVDTVTIEVTAQDRVTHKTYTVLVSRDMGRNAQLSRLEVSAGMLSPAFDPAVTRYVDSVSAEERFLQVSASSADPTASVRIDGQQAISGQPLWVTLTDSTIDSVVVAVSAEDTTMRQTYTMIIVRRPSANAFLRELQWLNASRTNAFHPQTTLYRDTVGSAVCTTRVKAVADGGGTLTLRGDTLTSGVWSGPVALRGGDNILPVEVTAADGVSRKTYTIVITRALGTSADISALSSPSVFSPAFTTAVSGYADTVEFEQNSYALRVSAVDPNATVTVAGDTVGSGSAHSVDLAAGTAAIAVRVVSEDRRASRTWQVMVTRRSDVALAGMAVSAGVLVPAFHPESLFYRVIVENDTAAIRLTPALRVPATTALVVNGSPQPSGNQSAPVSLLTGVNAIAVRCEGVDGISARTYSVVVTRKPSTNASLQGLAVSSGTLRPAFNPDTLVYRDTVDQAVNAMTLTPSVVHTAARAAVNGSFVPSGLESQTVPLPYFDDTIRVTVTAHDSVTQKTYTVFVFRRPNTNASLCSLRVSGTSLSPTFDSTVLTYTAYVPYQTSKVVVTPRLANPGAGITVRGATVPGNASSDSLALVVGANTIPVVVTAMDGITRKTYTVAVNRHARDSVINGMLVTGSDTLKKSGSPYHLTSGVLVSVGATLVIEPGVVLLMDGRTGWSVKGSLVAVGTVDDSIRFTSYDAQKPWGCLLFGSSAVDGVVDGGGNHTGGCIMEYCVVEYTAGNIPKAGAVHIDSAAPPIRHCSIRKNLEKNGIDALAPVGLRISDCEIYENLSLDVNNGYVGAGVQIFNGQDCRIERCDIRDNSVIGGYAAGIALEGCTNTTVERCVIRDNNGGGVSSAAGGTTTIRNCVLTGNTNRFVVSFEFGARLSMDSCLLAANNTGAYATVYFSQDNVGGKISNCLVKANSNTSCILYLRTTQVGDSVCRNTFYGNSGPAVYVSTGAYGAYAKPIIAQNSLWGGAFDWAINDAQEQTYPNVDAGRNYWGTTDENVIKNRIYDWFDDNSRGVVAYAPFLTAPDPSCPDTSWTPLPGW